MEKHYKALLKAQKKYYKNNKDACKRRCAICRWKIKYDFDDNTDEDFKKLYDMKQKYKKYNILYEDKKISAKKMLKVLKKYKKIYEYVTDKIHQFHKQIKELKDKIKLDDG